MNMYILGSSDEWDSAVVRDREIDYDVAGPCEGLIIQYKCKALAKAT